MKMEPTIRRVLRGCRNLVFRVEDNIASDKWVFLHLPKCGGTSVAAGLQRALGAGPDGFVDPIQTRQWAQNDLPDEARAEGSETLFRIRLNVLRTYADKGYSLLYGHFPLDEYLFAQENDGYRWLTVLRDPVERLLSQFKYWTLTCEPSAAKNLSSIEHRWEAYLGSDLCQYHANLYSYYLGGHAVGFNGNRAKEMRERAQANLEGFDVYGCIEDQGAVAEAFENQSGRPVRFRRLNSSETNSETQRQIRVLEEFEQRVDRDPLRELTRHDAEIYRLARL